MHVNSSPLQVTASARPTLVHSTGPLPPAMRQLRAAASCRPARHLRLGSGGER